MNVTFVNELEGCPDACPFAKTSVQQTSFTGFAKGVQEIIVRLFCEYGEVCKYRQTSDGDSHVS